MFKLFKRKNQIDINNPTEEEIRKWEEQRSKFILNNATPRREEA